MASDCRDTSTDPVTGRTVHRFGLEGVNVSPYFNSYAWTPQVDWFCFTSLRDDGHWVMACEFATGRVRRLAGPYPPPCQDGSELLWCSLNTIPGRRAFSYQQGRAVWQVELDDPQPERVAALPYADFAGSDTDVSGDGRWHVLACTPLTPEARADYADMTWPPDPVYEKHDLRSDIVRVALDGSGEVQTLWREDGVATHVSVCPTDADMILLCHEGTHPWRFGRMFLRRVGDEVSRPLRDQRSGQVFVTHERWFSDGRRIAYHGFYRDPGDPDSHDQHFVGIFDVARDLPAEYVLTDPELHGWHTTPSPDGTRLVMDQQWGRRGLFLLHLDREAGLCRPELVCSVCSDDAPLPHNQWRELDPIWSPDGRRVLFRAAGAGTVDMYVVEL